MQSFNDKGRQVSQFIDLSKKEYFLCIPRDYNDSRPAPFPYIHIVLFICLSSARQLKCLRVSKTESYGISRICFEIRRQATMPSSSAEVSSRIQNRELRSQ
jgi:hypothetical protein